jgi:hypothetical protein
MREWLYQNREVLMVVLTAIIAVGVFLGPYLTEKVRQKYETRHEYRNRLARATLSPIRGVLDQHYLQLLQNQFPVIGVIIERVHKDVPPDKWAEEGRASLGVIGPRYQMEPGAIFLYHGTRTADMNDVTSLLWLDARRHFPAFFKDWDSFEAEFRKYAAECLNATDRMYQEIRSKVQLPEWALRILDPPWVNALALACYAFARRQGVEGAAVPLLPKPSGSPAPFTTLQYQTTDVMVASEEDVEGCTELIAALSVPSSEKDEIDAVRKRVLEQAVRLRTTLTRMILE